VAPTRDVPTRAAASSQHAELAARPAAFELVADRDGVLIRSANLAGLELRFFELERRAPFSRQPFVQSDARVLVHSRPAYRAAIELTAAERRVAWPEQLRGKNIVVEAVGAGSARRRHHANDSRPSSRTSTARSASSAPRAALRSPRLHQGLRRKRGGQVAFYKDG